MTPSNSQRPPAKGGRKASASGRKGAKPKRPLWRRMLKWTFYTGLSLALMAVVGFVALYNLVDIPTPNAAFQSQTSQVFYKDGKTSLGTFADQNRHSIPLSEVPQHVQDAVVAAEDRTFWTNSGIDPKGIVRAAFSNARGNATQGASTITQQYVKILYLTSERSITRKAKEAIVSIKLARQQSKKQILEGYLNTIYFGRGAYGIQAAAQAYFHVDASQLTVDQGAALAAILNSPGYLDPANGKAARDRLFGRYQYVIGGMAAMGKLSAADAQTYKARLPHFPKQILTQKFAGQKGFMLAMIRSQLHDIGLSDSEIDTGGIKVTSTFSKSTMAAIKQGVLSQKPPGLKELHIGAVSIDNKSGAVRGIYGGQDYLKSSFNWALAGGQPGSSFKAFALAAGIKAGFNLKSTFQGNSPYTFPDGTEVRNETEGIYQNGRNFGSKINLITATEQSVNTAFMDLTASIPNGPTKIRDMAQAMGVPVDKYQVEANSGIALGTTRVGEVDMANAYATIANGGTYHPWYVVQKVVDASGKVIYEHPKGDGTRALPKDIDADVSYALQQVVEHGTGTAARAINRPAGGKTGTATNDKDRVSSAWFIGFTPQTTTAVMYVRGKGNDPLDGYLPQYFGGSYPARTWAAIMTTEMAGLPVVDFPPPAYVTGTPPTDGHSPAPTPKPRPKPSKKPTPTPSPTPSPSPTTPPTDSPSPTPSPTTTPTAGAAARQSAGRQGKG